MESRKPKIRFKGFTDPWEQRKLGEVASIKTGPFGSLLHAGEYVDDGIPIVTTEHFKSSFLPDEKAGLPQVSESDRARLEQYSAIEGDILFSRVGSVDVNAQVTAAQSGWLFSGRVLRVRPATSVISPNYLHYELSTDDVKRSIINRAVGGTMASTNTEILEETEISFPRSVKEQLEIGGFLGNLDTLITLHQRKLNALKKVKKSLLEKMFPKPGEFVPEIRFKGFTDPWEQRKLGEVADRYDNLRIPITASERVPGSTPYYGANGIQDYVEGFTHQGEFVLIAEDGASDLDNYPTMCINGTIWVNNHAHVIQGRRGLTDNHFVAWSIKRCDIKPMLTGGTRAKLNAEVLMGMGISTPNYAEQISIGSFFEQFDHLITLHQRKLNALKNVKKSLLEKMFV